MRKIFWAFCIFARRTIAVADFIAVSCFKIMLYGGVLALVVFAPWCKEKAIPENIILKIALPEEMPEGYSTADQMRVLFLGGAQPILFGEYIEALWAAVRDPRVAGVLVTFGAHNLTFSQAQELREVFLTLRSHGKPVWVYGDNFRTATYCCASSATRIILPKEGCCAPTGFAAVLPFAKEGLDKLGVETFSAQRKEYKNLAEMFTSTKASAATKEAYTDLLNTWKGQFERALARDGHLKVSSVASFVDNAPYMAVHAHALNAVHKLWTFQTCRAAFREYLKKNKERAAHYIGMRRYFSDLATTKKKHLPTIAIIYLKGEIDDGEESISNQSISAAALTDSLREAGKDKNVKAIVLRVNSPGGSLSGSGKLSAIIAMARRKYDKPIVVSMGSVAASGGYWIAAPADYIVANPATLTGSIGIVNIFFSSEELMKKLGIAWEVYASHKNAAHEVGVRPLSEEAKAHINTMIDEGYRLFVEHVALHRKRSIAEIEAVAKGRVWTGEQAYRHHLIDKIGGLHTAVQEARRLAKIDSEKDICWHHMTEVGSPWSMIKALVKGTVHVSLFSVLQKFGALCHPFQLQAKQERVVFSPEL